MNNTTLLSQAIACLDKVACVGYFNHVNIAKAMELISQVHESLISSEEKKEGKDAISAADPVQ